MSDTMYDAVLTNPIYVIYRNLLKQIFLCYSDDSAGNENMVLHIAEETDDDLLTNTPTTHTTEDLFTIIHRSEYAQSSRVADVFSQTAATKV